jgi:hypothetical protein
MGAAAQPANKFCHYIHSRMLPVSAMKAGIIAGVSDQYWPCTNLSVMIAPEFLNMFFLTICTALTLSSYFITASPGCNCKGNCFQPMKPGSYKKVAAAVYDTAVFYSKVIMITAARIIGSDDCWSSNCCHIKRKIGKR